jgi:periplasmic protein TonB
MKLIITSLFLLFGVSVVFGETSVKDTNSYPATAHEPEYPGGPEAFSNYITRKLHYPDAARLICINGKVYVSFVVDKDGKVKNVTPLNCVGAGCESEAVKVVQMSKQWKPGFQNGSPVSVNYTIPINFNMESTRVYMDNLQASDYGFVFEINGKLYSLSEAYRMLGKSFSPVRIDSAEPFVNQNNDQKFLMPNKKIIYLLIIKPNKPS